MPTPGDKAPLGAAGFQAATGVSRETMDRLETYAGLLAHWQPRLNLVSTPSLADVWRRHFLDSAQLADHLPATARVITDLGSGAGFPGIVLALITGLETHLVESDGRKAAFLRAVVRATGASIRVHNERIETVTPWPTDVITARALAPLTRLIAYAVPFPPRQTGMRTVFMFLKGKGYEEELTMAKKSWHMRNEVIRSVSDPSGRIMRIWDVGKANK